ncbi:hypothetical protein Leryth_007153, partial [Lithospermum erythrorhizon]
MTSQALSILDHCDPGRKHLLFSALCTPRTGQRRLILLLNFW